MVEIMMYLWLTVWQPIVFNYEHGQVSGQAVSGMAHTGTSSGVYSGHSNSSSNSNHP